MKNVGGRTQRYPWACVAIACGALAVSGCVTSVLAHEIVQQGDNWTITLTSLTDGPDSMVTGGFPAFNWTPGNGRKFIHAFVKVRNEAHERRRFSFNRCDMDDPRGVVVPSLVTTTTIIAEASRTEEVDPGDSVSRQLLFSVPKHYSPKRLTCAPMVFPLPELQDR